MAEPTQYTSETAPSPNVNATLSEMSVIAQKMHAKTASSEDTQRLFRVLDPAFNTRITAEFNRRSNPQMIGKEHQYDNDATSRELKQSALQHSDAPQKSLSQYETYEKTPTYDLDTVKSLIKSTPSLHGFSLNDAIQAAGSQQQQASVFAKFPHANQNILLACAYTLLDNSQNELKQRHPDFYNKHQVLGTNFSDIAAINIFYSAQDSQAYQLWEAEKRAQIIDRIAKDPKAQQALSEIISPLNTKSVHDILNQYDARRRLAEQVTQIYSQVYGLETLSPSDVKVLHKSINEFSQNSTTGFAWQTRSGVKNDELVILNYNPTWGLFLRDNPETTDTAARQNFLYTLTEELEHTKDYIMTDRLVNGTLDQNHPAFNHTSLILLNRLNYTMADNYDGYNAQIIERSAKEIAAKITDETIKRFDTSQNKPAGSGEQAPTIIIQSAPLPTQSPFSFTPKQ